MIRSCQGGRSGRAKKTTSWDEDGGILAILPVPAKFCSAVNNHINTHPPRVLVLLCEMLCTARGPPPRLEQILVIPAKIRPRTAVSPAATIPLPRAPAAEAEQPNLPLR